MNQFFSFKRFTLLVLKHWADNKKRYGLSVLAFIGLLITWFVFTLLVEPDIRMPKDVQQITYFFSLFVVGTFYASQYFSDLGSRSKGINFLLVPASAFEKLLCSLLYTVVLFFVVFTTIFYIVDSLMVAISSNLPGNNEVNGKPTVVNVFKIIILRFNRDSTINFLLLYFSVQSVFLLGSVFFEKYSFIFLAAALIASFFGVSFDYWGIKQGWTIELLGMLLLQFAATLYGVALLRLKIVPISQAILLLGSIPFCIISFLLLKQIPSAPTLPFALASIALGLFILRKSKTQENAKVAAFAALIAKI